MTRRTLTALTLAAVLAWVVAGVVGWAGIGDAGGELA